MLSVKDVPHFDAIRTYIIFEQVNFYDQSLKNVSGGRGMGNTALFVRHTLLMLQDSSESLIFGRLIRAEK